MFWLYLYTHPHALQQRFRTNPKEIKSKISFLQRTGKSIKFFSKFYSTQRHLGIVLRFQCVQKENKTEFSVLIICLFTWFVRPLRNMAITQRYLLVKVTNANTGTICVNIAKVYNKNTRKTPPKLLIFRFFQVVLKILFWCLYC